jgi:hypothetical protein
MNPHGTLFAHNETKLFLCKGTLLTVYLFRIKFNFSKKGFHTGKESGANPEKI